MCKDHAILSPLDTLENHYYIIYEIELPLTFFALLSDNSIILSSPKNQTLYLRKERVFRQWPAVYPMVSRVGPKIDNAALITIIYCTHA